MAGRDRIIDPITRDYVSDGRGGRQTTRTARTAIYHRLARKRGQWWGDPSGSRFHELRRAKNPTTSPAVIREIVTEALEPLVEQARITAPEFVQERSAHRVVTSISARDLQSGEALELLDLLPALP